MKKLIIVSLATLLLSVAHVLAYGFEGHALVGAIADARLAGTPTGAKVSAILGGMTLARAATLPDEIKGWDKYGTDAPGGFHLPEYPEIEKQLREFTKANSTKTPRSEDDSDAVPSHHWFHYTDIPIRGHDHYSQGKHGRSKWDIVQMLSYCVGVLNGTIPEDNPRKITKAVAIILATHYVGDIHQPLHVGAEFFNKEGKPVDPDALGNEGALEDQGGNTLFLILNKAADSSSSTRKLSLHGFWDKVCAQAAIAKVGAQITREDPTHAPEFTPQEIATRLVVVEPTGWNSTASEPPVRWAELWADEILPVAREAHDRLEYSDVRPKTESGSTLAAGFAREKAMPDQKSYTEWSGEVVETQLAKAGWRLAALLEKSLP